MECSPAGGSEQNQEQFGIEGQPGSRGRKRKALAAPRCHPANRPFADRLAFLKEESEGAGRQRQAKSYVRVLRSLGKYPLPLLSAHDAATINGVGKALMAIFEQVQEELAANRQDDGQASARGDFRAIESQWRTAMQQRYTRALATPGAHGGPRADVATQTQASPKKKPRSTGLRSRNKGPGGISEDVAASNQEAPVAASPPLHRVDAGGGGSSAGHGARAMGQTPAIVAGKAGPAQQRASLGARCRQSAAARVNAPAVGTSGWLLLVCLGLYAGDASGGALSKATLHRCADRLRSHLPRCEALRWGAAKGLQNRGFLQHLGEHRYKLTEFGQVTAERLLRRLEMPLTALSPIRDDDNPPVQPQSRAREPAELTSLGVSALASSPGGNAHDPARNAGPGTPLGANNSDDDAPLSRLVEKSAKSKPASARFRAEDVGLAAMFPSEVFMIDSLPSPPLGRGVPRSPSEPRRLVDRVCDGDAAVVAPPVARRLFTSPRPRSPRRFPGSPPEPCRVADRVRDVGATRVESPIVSPWPCSPALGIFGLTQHMTDLESLEFRASQSASIALRGAAPCRPVSTATAADAAAEAATGFAPAVAATPAAQPCDASAERFARSRPSPQSPECRLSQLADIALQETVPCRPVATATALDAAAAAATAPAPAVAAAPAAQQCAASAERLARCWPSPPAQLVLLLDHREVGAGRDHASRGAFLADLVSRLGASAAEGRALPLGDILWVWRELTCPPGTANPKEFIAGWVVERKTLHDLSGSVTDGRYDEQKARLLKAPGLHGVFYILEGSGALFGVAKGAAGSAQTSSRAAAAQRAGFGQRLLGRTLSDSALASAAVNTQLIAGFHVAHTSCTKHTVDFLVSVHEELQRLGPPQQPRPSRVAAPAMGHGHAEGLLSYREFAERTRKSCHPQVFETFGRMLRVIPQCGPEATEALVDEFPTPQAFVHALRNSSDTELLLRLKARRGGRCPVSVSLLTTCRALFLGE